MCVHEEQWKWKWEIFNWPIQWNENDEKFSFGKSVWQRVFLLQQNPNCVILNVLFLIWETMFEINRHFYWINRKKRAISTKEMGRSTSRAETPMSRPRLVEEGISEGHKMNNWVFSNEIWYNMAGDTSWSETRQGGSERPRRRRLGVDEGVEKPSFRLWKRRRMTASDCTTFSDFC